jgi:hypothetical protein
MLWICPSSSAIRNRYTLHDLHKVACSVFRPQKAETCARGGSHSFHVPVEITTAVRVHLDCYRLARTHVLEPCFLEIGGDPYTIERNDTKETSPEEHPRTEHIPVTKHDATKAALNIVILETLVAERVVTVLAENSSLGYFTSYTARMGR